MRKVYAYVRKNGDAIIRRNAILYSGKKNEFKPDELVWYLCPRKVTGKPDKWTSGWIGPFRVMSVMSEVLVTIKAISGLDKILTVHVSRI